MDTNENNSSMRESVSVAITAKILGKDSSWIRIGIIEGWLPIGIATRNGKQVTDIRELGARFGRISYFISIKKLSEFIGRDVKELLHGDRYTE